MVLIQRKSSAGYTLEEAKGGMDPPCALCSERWLTYETGKCWYMAPDCLTSCDFSRRVREGEESEFLWIKAHSTVYRVPREWASNVHPGGSRSLFSRHGKDCTVDFEFHSPHTQSHIWGKFKEGKIIPCTGKPQCGVV